ncbi:MAG TPA: acetyl-CoA carboxylase, carboxyltransferase subunit beta [Candidatus Sumerlaeota bacterium]|nr:acetyl-CoA carboxylase, carboxyltransferase subunit beta [Candidatus Sumerlaeota bacterium]
MLWHRNRKYTILKPPEERKVAIPNGLWHKCPECLHILLARDYEKNLWVCPKCNFHDRLNVWQRIACTFDPDSFQEDNKHIYPTDPLSFSDSMKYTDRVTSYQKKTGLPEAVVTGSALCGGYKTIAAVMEFNFGGGSMGSVVGEKVTRAFERGIAERLPVIVICASGGARMQEAILSLMQMAKTSMAIARFAEEKLPYITLLTHPTTAGVMASFASLGDVIIAEPNALIGFAGPRVIQQTINQILPKGFQKSEFVMEHGFIDVVANRKDIRSILTNLLSCFAPWAAEKNSGIQKEHVEST